MCHIEIIYSRWERERERESFYSRGFPRWEIIYSRMSLSILCGLSFFAIKPALLSFFVILCVCPEVTAIVSSQTHG